MKVFDLLEKLERMYPTERVEVVDEPRKKYYEKKGKATSWEMKEYKHRYYLEHIETYRKRNKELNAKWSKIRKEERLKQM